MNYLYITDLVSQKEVNIKYCPTDEMIVDHMTKRSLVENLSCSAI